MRWALSVYIYCGYLSELPGSRPSRLSHIRWTCPFSRSEQLKHKMTYVKWGIPPSVIIQASLEFNPSALEYVLLDQINTTRSDSVSVVCVLFCEVWTPNYYYLTTFREKSISKQDLDITRNLHFHFLKSGFECVVSSEYFKLVLQAETVIYFWLFVNKVEHHFFAMKKLYRLK